MIYIGWFDEALQAKVIFKEREIRTKAQETFVWSRYEVLNSKATPQNDSLTTNSGLFLCLELLELFCLFNEITY